MRKVVFSTHLFLLFIGGSEGIFVAATIEELGIGQKGKIRYQNKAKVLL